MMWIQVSLELPVDLKLEDANQARVVHVRAKLASTAYLILPEIGFEAVRKLLIRIKSG